MPSYEVTVLIDASMSCTVEADSPEEAETKACDKVGSPNICHQCSDEINVGDCTGAMVYDSKAETLLLDTTYAAQRIRELEAQVAALKADSGVQEDTALTITWPAKRDVGRIGDMSLNAHLRVGLDNDNDVYVSVWDESGGGSVEFCNPGGGGGGQSSKTRMALIALMVAMESDNAANQTRDWWAIRDGAALAAKGETP